MRRGFLHHDCQAGVFHCTSRFLDKVRHFSGDEPKRRFMEIVWAYTALLGVEVLTFCVMNNHFHLLVRVPRRPAGFDVPMDVLLARMERAIGAEAMALVRTQLDLWARSGLDSAIEEWRQRQMARMFNLSEFMRCVKLRFTRWHNANHNRRGTIWEEKFGSVVVQEEERALRTIAAYIDLNPVRAGLVEDPADYPWCGYAEAMAGKARARRGLVRIVGKAAWAGQRFDAGDITVSGEARPDGVVNVEMEEGAGAGEEPDSRGHSQSRGQDVGRVYEEPSPWSDREFPAWVERRALVFYRALLGGQGAERRREDGTVVRRGMSARVKDKLMSPNERRLAAEVLTRRVQHFTRGVIFGGRAFVDEWFEGNRTFVTGRSQIARKRGSKSLGKPALRGLYALRDPKA